ncbi:Alpha-xylosidase BoGH31A (plasmid) [Asticcacaulis sp. MM231]|uniref:glycoside hydrolase family 31 protein n=1 Tax=Asticcacaulis sp. MM231 TaxID=3157666 RepID=UPI0032D5AB12
MNTEVGLPILVSSAGYGILWHNPAITDVDVGIPQADDSIAFRTESGKGIDYHFIYGPALDTVVGEYRTITGQVPMMALWTWGLFQSKERYASQAELLEVATHYRNSGIPLDAVVQDWQYWAPNQWGSQNFDPNRFPKPEDLMRDLHDMNLHAIISVWPKFDVGTDTQVEMEKVGGLYPKVYNNVWPVGKARWYDPFNPDARKLYWQQISQGIGSKGFDGWWLDGSEAELGGEWGEFKTVPTAKGMGETVFNAYPLMHTTAVYEGALRDFPQKRPIILTRSAYLGQQRNAAITWSGDVGGTWEVLSAQVPAALNFSISGIPYWSVDLGGFFFEHRDSPGYTELFTRWLQFGAFNPMFRIHGSGAGKEIWAFPEAVQPQLIDTVKLRYRLLPYIYALSWDVTHKSGTMMRPLSMDFPQDEAVLKIPDQYSFGRGLLVSPVVKAGATSRPVYLPKGTNWYDFWTGELREGGQTLEVAAPIDQIPLHVATGTILPMGPNVQYSGENAGGPLEIRVYRGSNGEFTLYDDAGDGQGWRKGERAEIPLRLEDAKGMLRIGARIGTYPNMPKTRIFHVVVVGATQGTGIAETEKTKGTFVTYQGKALSVKLPSE